MKFIFVLIFCFSASVFAQEPLAQSASPELIDSQDLGPALDGDLSSPFADREPASLSAPARKRAYPGGADEEDLKVQSALPEAIVKIDSRTVQRDIYKQLYNQELKEEHQNDLEEE